MTTEKLKLNKENAAKAFTNSEADAVIKKTNIVEASENSNDISLAIKDLCKSYGNKNALVKASASFPDHSFTCIVGKSGCGKTTLLRLLAGLETPSSGKVQLPAGKIVAPVFQEPRLLPWLTAAQNIAFAAKKGQSVDTQRLQSLLELLQLTEAADLYPSQLSGGMAQRVALGRTLYYNPDVLLMDEPFSALDYFTRRELQQTLLALYYQERKTVIFVTHDVEEAVLLGDRVIVMAEGAIKSTVPVNLPRPRQADQPEVQALRGQILQALL